MNPEEQPLVASDIHPQENPIGTTYYDMWWGLVGALFPGRSIARQFEALDRISRLLADSNRLSLTNDMIGNLRNTLGHPQVTLEEAARRVVGERNVAQVKVQAQASTIEAVTKERDKMSYDYQVLAKKVRGMVQVPFNCDRESLFEAMDRYAARYSDRNNITDALGMPNTSTHDEVLAECISLVRFREETETETETETEEPLNPPPPLPSGFPAPREALELMGLQTIAQLKAEQDQLREDLRQAHAARFVLQEQFAAMRTERDAAKEALAKRLEIPSGWAQTPPHLRVRAIGLVLTEMRQAREDLEPEKLADLPPIVQKVESAFHDALVELHGVVKSLLLDPEDPEAPT